ncbi:MAG: PD-(D/E)XK nuclease family protein, partial [Alphaproteobacteria bacterium]|nr:PD-(D/E)XK nuclease family protein [Alphaproteobacteria bacterium]
MGEKSVREAVNHPRLKLLSPIQGAYSHYDTAILCGLNEGVWPTNPSANPWLNRDMSLLLGLPDAQVLIGRAASLLAQNMTCPKVYLSFSKRRGTEPATPSRWVLRLQALAQKLNHPMSQKNPDTLGDLQRKLDQPDQPLILQAPRPCPPQKFRPTRFSISEVERFLRDPYQIHAKRILKLAPLPTLNEPFTQADFGTWVHKVLEQSVLQNKPLESLTRAYLPQSLPRETATLWLKSFTLFHPWIVTFLQKQKEQSLETFVEKKLTRSFDIQGTTYELVGKADRIDRLMDGTYEIIDYKTGTPPSKASVLQGDAPQLPLLAYLFEKNTPHAHVSKLTYVGLTSQKTQSIICENLANDTARRLF